MNYPNDLTVREARERYFSNSGFDASTYTDRWVKLPVLGFKLHLPNFKARKKAVPLHDIDHILTEYQTNWMGEIQIAAYETGTGCGRYWAAWFINSQGILVGALLTPAKSVRAFARGRLSLGIYGYPAYEPLLAERVGELRQKTTASDASVTPTLGDAALFFLLALVSATIHIGLPLLVLYLLLF